MAGGKLPFLELKQTVWIVKWKHSPKFMDLVYIWHVEISFQEEKKFLETDPDYLSSWGHIHQRKASRATRGSAQNNTAWLSRTKDQGRLEPGK